MGQEADLACDDRTNWAQLRLAVQRVSSVRLA